MSPSTASSSPRLSATHPKPETKRRRLTKEYVHHFDTIGRTRASRLHLTSSTPDPSLVISDTQPTRECAGETRVSSGVVDNSVGTVKWKDEIEDGKGLLTSVTVVGDVNVAPRTPDYEDRAYGSMRSTSTVAGIPHSDGRKSTEHRRLRCELGKMNARGIPYDQFLAVIHPSLGKLPPDLLRKMKAPLRKLRDGYLQVVDNENSSEYDLYAPFAELVLGIVKANGGKIAYVKTHGKRKLLGAVGNARRSPDGVFVRKRRGQRGPTHPDEVNWRDVLLPIDLKRKENFRASLQPPTFVSEMTEGQIERESEKVGDATLDGRQQLGGYGLEQLSSNPLKRFGTGMIVIDSLVETWYYDRCGTIGSNIIDLRRPDDFELFCRHISAMARAGPQEFGFSPQFSASDWPIVHDKQEITVAGRAVLFDASKPISVTRGLIGRCTFVFAATTRDDVSGRDRICILKLSYQPSHREPSELDHYRLLTEKGVEGIPAILCSEKLSSLEDGPRGALSKYLPHYEFGPTRYLEAIVMDEEYKPITTIDIKDTKLFFQVFLSIVETHHQAYEEAGVLHRDVHVDNLMWTVANGRPVGKLIDWDFASGPVSHPPEDPQQSTFTLNVAFLAVDLLQKECPPRLYRHDLESFFWVLWFIIISKANIADLDSFARISQWEQGDMDQRRISKTAFLARGRRDALERLSTCKHPGLSRSGVLQCLSTLGDQILRGQDALRKRIQCTNVETAEGHITYAGFMTALKLAVYS